MEAASLFLINKLVIYPIPSRIYVVFEAETTDNCHIKTES